MAVKFPEIDRSRISGGSSLWDETVGGVVLADDYFVTAAPPSGGGQVKTFLGGSFVVKPVKVWNGSAWVIKPLKHWNGSAWVETSY